MHAIYGVMIHERKTEIGPLRKKITALVILNMMVLSMATLPAAAAYVETVDVYQYSVGGTITWSHTYDHSEDPICTATLCIVADDVDGPGGGDPPDGEQDEVWVMDQNALVWVYLGLLNDMGYYTNWAYQPGPGNDNQPVTTTCFDIDPAWINGLPVEVRIETSWGVEIETSTLTIGRCVPAPLFSDLLAMLSIGILAGVMVIRRQRLAVN